MTRRGTATHRTSELDHARARIQRAVRPASPRVPAPASRSVSKTVRHSWRTLCKTEQFAMLLLKANSGMYNHLNRSINLRRHGKFSTAAVQILLKSPRHSRQKRGPARQFTDLHLSSANLMRHPLRVRDVERIVTHRCVYSNVGR